MTVGGAIAPSCPPEVTLMIPLAVQQNLIIFINTDFIYFDIDYCYRYLLLN